MSKKSTRLAAALEDNRNGKAAQCKAHRKEVEKPMKSTGIPSIFFFIKLEQETHPESFIGVDFGLTDLAVTSEGKNIRLNGLIITEKKDNGFVVRFNPKALKEAENFRNGLVGESKLAVK